MSAVSDMLATSVGDSAIVVLSRLVLPRFIPRLPLIIVAALVLDAADQTILQQLTEIDTTETGLVSRKPVAFVGFGA